MPLKFGTTTISTLKYGTTNITTGKFGSTTVFSSNVLATIVSGTYANCYLAITSTATSGSPNVSCPPGTTVYAFVKLTQAISTSYVDSNWVLISGTNGAANAIYRVGSHTMGQTDYSFGTIHARTLQKPWIDCRIEGNYGTNPNVLIEIINYNETDVWINDYDCSYYIESSSESDDDSIQEFHLAGSDSFQPWGKHWYYFSSDGKFYISFNSIAPVDYFDCWCKFSKTGFNSSERTEIIQDY